MGIINARIWQKDLIKPAHPALNLPILSQGWPPFMGKKCLKIHGYQRFRPFPVQIF
jgi:hypothetical protein